MTPPAPPGPRPADPELGETTVAVPVPGPAMSRSGWAVTSAGLVLVVAMVDYLTGVAVALDLFYLVPIGTGTWFISRRAGVILAAASSTLSLLADGLHRIGATDGDSFPLPVLSWNAAVQLGTSVALVVLLAALRSRLLDQERLARTDALTQIPNRRAFLEAAVLELERARRHRRPLTLAYLDCDGFKDVNDRLGHRAGDALLVTAAATLRTATRAVDAVARLGGDEFGLLLPETDAAEAAALVERVRATLATAMARSGWAVSFSFGAAVFLDPPATVDELMARADELMYAAKREAKGSVRLATFGVGPHDPPLAAEG